MSWRRTNRQLWRSELTRCEEFSARALCRIVQQLLAKSTDFLWRIIALVKGQGGFPRWVSQEHEFQRHRSRGLAVSWTGATRTSRPAARTSCVLSNGCTLLQAGGDNLVDTILQGLQEQNTPNIREGAKEVHRSVEPGGGEDW